MFSRRLLSGTFCCAALLLLPLLSPLATDLSAGELKRETGVCHAEKLLGPPFPEDQDSQGWDHWTRTCVSGSGGC